MRVLIVEDSVLLREGLVRLLADAGHDVVAALPDAHGLSDAVTEDSPDLAILDVRLPRRSPTRGFVRRWSCAAPGRTCR